MTDPNNITVNGTYFPIQQSHVPFTLGFVFSFFAMSLNGILIIVMTKERKSFFNTRVSYFVFNLAVVDCLTGVSLAYFQLQQMISSIPFQKFVVILNWVTIQISFYTLFLMSVDRLVIVLYSLSWSNILTIRRTIISIKIVWLVSITGGVIMHFYANETRLATSIFVELCCLIFVCNSLFIYPVLKKREQGRFTSDTPSSARSFRPVSQDKMSSVIIILMIVLIITQLPFIVCYQVFLVHKLAGKSIYGNLDIKTYINAYLYSQAFACLNFVVNPIVYAWRIRTYRKAFVQTFTC